MTGAAAWIWAISTTHTQIKTGPNTRLDPPTQAPQTIPHPGLARRRQNPPARRPQPAPKIPSPHHGPRDTPGAHKHLPNSRRSHGGRQTPRPNLQTYRRLYMHAPRANTSTDAPHANPARRPFPLPSQPPPKGPHSPSAQPSSPATWNPPPDPTARKRPPRTAPRRVYPPPPTTGNPERPAKQSPTPHGTPTQ